jgi:GTP cyclohydrolase I
MNPATQTLPDVQAQVDGREVALDEVGISGLSYPVCVLGPNGDSQNTVAEVEMTASLAAAVRGTHMSRFVEVLHDARERVTPATAVGMAQQLRQCLDAGKAQVRLSFPLFVEREAPVSGKHSMLRLDCRFEAESTADGDTVRVGVTVPVTSLCPCSKEISDYGAHSQRGQIDIVVESPAGGRDCISPRELLAVADDASSAPIIPLLKRADERHLTMAAYDKPAFVEDLARDVAVALRADRRVAAFDIAVSNAESIHDHQAVARVRWRHS